MAYVAKYRYQKLRDLLNTKYTIIEEANPFVGDKYSKFHQDETLIELDAPHMAPVLTLTYMQKGLVDLQHLSLSYPKALGS